MKGVGIRIKQARKGLGLTQIQFCDSICISQSHLSAIEKGKYKPSKAVIRLISSQYSIDESWLIDG